MTPQPASSLSAGDLARLRARHLADQQAAARAHQRPVPRAAVLAARLLVIVFVLAGVYSCAAAAGLLSAAPWSALATAGP